MGISSNLYVDITSGVGGVPAVRGRSLDLRVISTNELIPTGAVLAFDSISAVSDYFGSTSEEYKRAAFYFSYVSKQITKAKRISFARWANVDTSAQVFGAKAGTLAELQAFESDSITISLGGVEGTITPDLSSAASYTGVANKLQTAIQALEGSFESATVTYNSTKTSFNLDTNGTADGEINLTSDSEILKTLGWDSLATFSNGVTAQTVTEQLVAMADVSNDFGSYVYIDKLTLEQVEESATFNDTQNVSYQYHVQIEKSDAQNYYDTLKGYSGLGLTINETAGEYPEILPCAQLSSQDFNSTSASTNYMFINSPLLTPQVASDAEYTLYKGLRINFIGVTQESGNLIQFYQHGNLQGPITAPIPMGEYANEQWLKSTIKAAFLNLLVSLPNFPKDDTGLSFGNATLQAVVTDALNNKVISVGKTLSDEKKAFVNATTGDANAVDAIQGSGFWFRTYFTEEIEDGQTTVVFNYLLLYASSESVRKVSGTNTLI